MASRVANAGATLVGQNLGAGHPDRAEASVRIATKYNVIFLSVVGVLFVIFARPLAGIFTTDPEVFHHASRALWVVSLGFPLFAIGMCLEGAFNGAGDTRTPTRLNFYCLWLCQVSLAWLLAKPLGLGRDGHLHRGASLLLDPGTVERSALSSAANGSCRKCEGS